MVPIDFHSIFKVNGYHKLSGYQHSTISTEERNLYWFGTYSITSPMN